MAIHYKAYRFRMNPTRAQEAALLRQAGGCRFIWNWGLERRIEHYRLTGKSLNSVGLCRELTLLKSRDETAWLRDISSRALQQTLRNLDQAFVNFFEGRANFPRFKVRKRHLPKFRSVLDSRIVGQYVTVPKVGKIRLKGLRPIKEKIKSFSFGRDAAGRWHVSVRVQFESTGDPVAPGKPDDFVGIDLGLKDFAVMSSGERIPSPKFLLLAERRLRKLHRRRERREQGSKRRDKVVRQAAKISAKVADRRNDFLHKLTTRLIREFSGFAIEDLSVKGLARTKLAKSVHDAAWGEFRRQLTYKSEWNRRSLVVIDRWFPSTRYCRGCGNVNGLLTLKDRKWTCLCGMEHDRDLSAAINIRDEGLKRLAAGHAESLNARGRDVRPAIAGSSG